MSIARNSLAFWSFQVIDYVLRFVAMRFIAVELGPEYRGLLVAVLLANLTLMSMTNFGLQTASMFFVGKSPERVSQYHTLVVLLIALIVGLDIGVVLLGGDALRNVVFDGIEWRFLLFALVGLPFTFYAFAAQGILTGLGRVGRLSLLLIIFSFVLNGANLVLLIGFDFPPEKLVGLLLWFWLAGEVFKAVVLFVSVWRSPARLGRFPLGELFTQLREFLWYGARAFAGNFATFWINRMGNYAIIIVAGLAGLGVYGLAVTLAELVFYPAAALERAAYRRVAGTEPGESARLIRELFRTNLWVNGCAMIALALLAEPLVVGVVDARYASAVRPLQILLPGTLALSCCRILALYFSAQLGRPHIPAAIAWFAALINVSAMVTFVILPESNFETAAAVTTATYAVMLIIYLVLFVRNTGLKNPLDYLVPQSRDFVRIQNLLAGAGRFVRRPMP